MKRFTPTSSLISFVSVGMLGMLGMLGMTWPATAAAQVPGPPPITKPKPDPPPPKDPPPKDPVQPPGPTQPPAGPPKPSAPKETFSKAVIARVEAAKKEAPKLSKYGDALSAADLLEQAYLLIPEPELAFQIGQTAHRAKDCARAQAYYDRFLATAELADPAMVQLAQKHVNELRTFECPARTPEDDAALAETLSRRAVSLATEQDWLGAAIGYANAHALAPSRALLAYETGVASWKAHECGAAVSYFYHFVATADPRQHGKELKQSAKYINDSEAGKCQPQSSAAKADQARALYDQGQTREFAHDYLGAAGKYERAFELLPDNVVLAFRAAETLWIAQRCAEAQPHYRAFVAQATDPRFEEDRAKSENILARIDAHGCPAALSNTSTSGKPPVTSDGSQDPAPGDDGGGPPPIESGSSVACSIGVDEPANRGFGGGFGATAFGLIVLGLLRRRRASTIAG
jgi:hypothetical protein